MTDPGTAEPVYDGAVGPRHVGRPSPLLELGPVAPWGGRVTVTPLDLNGYPERMFDVIASWVGPGLPGAQTPSPGQLVHAHDGWMTPSLELARELAHRALRELAAGRIPDLRALAGELQKRGG